jgi:hypothetical protein
MATTHSAFESLPPEVRVEIYKYLPCTTKYATARRDEAGTPVVVFRFSYIERAIVAVSKLIRNEAESVIDSETHKCGPVQLIADCDYFHLIPEIMADVRNARNVFVPSNMGLADAERESFSTTFTSKNLIERTRMDAAMSQMWIRLANLYLRSDKRVEVGIWIANDAACDLFVQKLDSAIDDIVNPRWDAFDLGISGPKFSVTIECSDEVESDDVQDVVESFKDAHFEVSEELEPEAMELRWGVRTFDGLFEGKELSSDDSDEEMSEGSGEELDEDSEEESDED